MVNNDTFYLFKKEKMIHFMFYVVHCIYDEHIF